jgi:histidine triad (HIT) family protein
MPNCIFCNIIDKKTDTELLYENEEVVIFRDIKPASEFHFLCVSKKHINDTKSLKTEDKNLGNDLWGVHTEVLCSNDPIFYGLRYYAEFGLQAFFKAFFFLYVWVVCVVFALYSRLKVLCKKITIRLRPKVD